MIQTGIASGTKPAVVLMEHCDVRISLRPTIAYLARTIGRPVIDQQDFQVAIRLGDNAANAVVELTRNVVYGNDD